MLPRRYRLQADKDIKRVLRSGRRFMTPLFRIQVAKNSLNVTRFAFVVSLKVGKRATTRNLIKRRAREVVRSKISEFPTGFDIVITARSEAVAYTTPKKEGERTPHADVAKIGEIEKSINVFIKWLNKN